MKKAVRSINISGNHAHRIRANIVEFFILDTNMGNIRSVIKNAISILTMAVLTASCSYGVSRIQTCSLPSPNPTTYLFQLPLEEVHRRALQAFSSEHQVHEPIFGNYKSAVHLESILAAESSMDAVFSKEVFRDPANRDDIYLHTFHSPFVNSSVYFGHNGGLPFIARFHVHLVAIESNTLVTVTALDAEVVNGERYGFGLPGYGWIYEKVKPTTVEEYIILRYLGNYLGATNMPSAILPLHCQK